MPGAIRFATRMIRPRFCRSARTACGHARVLDLHRHVAAVLQPRAVDLPDRRGSHGLLVELVEHVAEPLAQVVLDHLRACGSNDTRGAESRSSASFAWMRSWNSGGKRARVDERGHLADLHRRALHLAEHVEDLLRRLHLAARRGGVAAPRRPSGPGWPPSWRSPAPSGRPRAGRPWRPVVTRPVGRSFAISRLQGTPRVVALDAAVTYEAHGHPRAALLRDGRVYDVWGDASRGARADRPHDGGDPARAACSARSSRGRTTTACPSRTAAAAAASRAPGRSSASA